jgi:5-methylcytosine-specific restriction endonuclease McrA
MSQKQRFNGMHQWFFYLFDERKDKEGFVKCFECGKRMHEDSFKHTLTCYSHILDKSLYPEFAGNEENVVIVHPDCHNLYTMRPKKALKQYSLRLKLLDLWENQKWKSQKIKI